MHLSINQAIVALILASAAASAGACSPAAPPQAPAGQVAVFDSLHCRWKFVDIFKEPKWKLELPDPIQTYEQERLRRQVLPWGDNQLDALRPISGVTSAPLSAKLVIAR